LIESVRSLEPGPRSKELYLKPGLCRGTEIDAIEEIIDVALGVERLDLRRIKEPAAGQSVHGEKISYALRAGAQRHRRSRRIERAVADGDRSGGSPDAQARPGRGFDDQACLVPVFGRRHAADHFERFDRVL